MIENPTLNNTEEEHLDPEFHLETSAEDSLPVLPSLEHRLSHSAAINRISVRNVRAQSKKNVKIEHELTLEETKVSDDLFAKDPDIKEELNEVTETEEVRNSLSIFFEILFFFYIVFVSQRTE